MCNVEPWRYTLRQLVWMSEAKGERAKAMDAAQWQKVAWIRYSIAASQATKAALKKMRPDDFNPTIEPEPEMTMGQMHEAAKKMAPTFEEHKKRLKNARRKRRRNKSR